METKKQYRQRLLKEHENDLVSMIYHFRDNMRKIQDVINHDLVKMTGEFPIFVSHAADELEKLARQQRELELALSVHELREFGYTKRVLERVVQWEKHSDSEVNQKLVMPRIGGLYTLKTTRDVTKFHIWRNKKPMSYCVGDALEGNGYNAEDFFCLLDYERDESTGWQYLNILSTNGITGYILCYNGEELVEVAT